MEKLPDEWLVCQFYLRNGEEFAVEYEKVEVDYVEDESEYRDGKLKRWRIYDADRLVEEITADEVRAVYVVVDEEYRDEVPELPSGGVEPGTTLDEDE